MKPFIAILIAFVIFFVVVCPFTPTPLAVVSGKTNSHHTQAIIPALMFLTAASAPTLIVIAGVVDRVEPSISTEAVDLTCARLC